MTNVVVVVGGSTGGVRSVQALRRAGFEGRLVLVSDEEHLPYDRPPLSKDLLAVDSVGTPVSLLSQAEVTELDVTLRLGCRAVGLDPDAKVLTIERGGQSDEVPYDAVVIATGVEARRLSGTDGIAGVHVIRRLEDARELRSLMGPGRKAVVVGAGFIGAEFASAARAHDMDVTIVEAQPVPLAHILGAEVGAEVASVHVTHGAELRTGRTVAAVESADGRVTSIRLDDGSELPADVVVVGIGASPATAWLADSGLPIGDGIDCDEDLQVLGFPGVYAVGDVARWPHPAYAAPIRIEHWTSAGDQAQVMAAHVVGRDRPAIALPYVWSDQYGQRIQIVGRPSEGTASTIHGAMATSDLVALYAAPDGRLVGALVVDNPRLFMQVRKAIAAGTPALEVEQSLLVTSL
ncbi:FAD-dependent oxidoreductase [Nocardioides sp. WS12]|uniref:NAD(P)/FAD-dependent oxidoreductase n=1 Tax=Nocardioides sp. WS12 TaxID=2486272 RepID=UPI0015F8A8E9|nr:FAD-dependent oxidoreductase [Nocardioides sp. WS12]